MGTKTYFEDSIDLFPEIDKVQFIRKPVTMNEFILANPLFQYLVSLHSENRVVCTGRVYSKAMSIYKFFV
ncbi:MAG: hypothetical protein ACR2IS_10480, partial [Nitrososphaeraceae archaeon]